MRFCRSLWIFTATMIVSLSLSAPWFAAASTMHTPITIAINGEACLCNLPVIVADRVGFFRAEGVDVVVNDYGTDIGVYNAFLNREAQIALGPLLHALTFWQDAPPPLAFVSVTHGLGLALLTRAPESSPILDIADLRGAKVGVTSSPATAGFLLDRLLDPHFLDTHHDGHSNGPNSAEIVRFDDEVSAIQALLEMEVDALLASDPTVTYLIREHAAQVLYDFRDSDAIDEGSDALDELVGTGLSSIVLYGDSEWIAQHTSEVERIATALVKANRWLHERPIEQVLAWLPQDVYRDHTGEPFDTQLLIEALHAAISTYSTSGLIDLAPEGFQFATQSFVQDVSAPAKQSLRLFFASNGLALLELLDRDEATYWQTTFETLPGVIVVNDPAEADVLVNVFVTLIDQHQIFSAQFTSADQQAVGRLPLLITSAAPIDDVDAPSQWVTTLTHALLTWLRYGAIAWWLPAL